MANLGCTSHGATMVIPSEAFDPLDKRVGSVGRIKDMIIRGGENIYPREVDGEELTLHCKGRISTFKIPRFWKFVDAFPMTVTGKIQKFKMREQSVEELKLRKAAAQKTA